MIATNLSYAIVFLAEACIAWQYFGYLFTPQKRNVHIIFSLLLGYTGLFAIYKLEITPLNTVAFFCVNYWILCSSFDCTSKTAILHVAFLCFIMTISEVLVGLIFAAFSGDFAAYTYDLVVMVPMAIMSKLLYLFLAVIGAKIFSPHKFANEEPHMMALFCSLPIMSAFISVVIAYLSLQKEWTWEAQLIIILSLLTLLIVNLIFFILYNHQQKVNAEYLALQLSKQKEAADVAYYQALQEQAEDQRVLIHDITNHLHIIDGLARTEKDDSINDYIAKLITTLTPEKQTHLCNNSILNLILCRYAGECKEKGIEFICDVRDSYSPFLDAPSITTLYGNLLSNAVEAAELSEDKIVEISSIYHPEQEVIVISVVNSCDTAPIPTEDGLFQTRKKSGIHGVGLKSIERIVRNHKGVETMHYNSDSKRFYHIVQFAL